MFKQDAVPHDMAGQFDEHEMARSLTPLLFSFSDRDAPTRYVKQRFCSVFTNVFVSCRVYLFTMSLRLVVARGGTPKSVFLYYFNKPFSDLVTCLDTGSLDGKPFKDSFSLQSYNCDRAKPS